LLEIVLNILIGLLILVISWKSTVFKGRTLLHVFVGVLIVSIGFFNGYQLYQKDDKILNLNELIDTLTVRLEPFAEFALQKYPGKELDEALKMFNQELESTIQRVTSIEDGTKQRLITTGQERILIDNLILIKELSKIYISYDASDLESRNYASQLSSVIEKVDIDIDTWTIKQMETSHSKGIIILSKSAESDILQDKISKVFSKANINHKCARGYINEDFDITIKIGPN